VAEATLTEVLWERAGHVRILTLNRPEKLNALTPEGLDRFRQLLGEYREDRSARTLIVTGAGRAFSTGIDLSRASELLGDRPTLSAILAEDLMKPAIAAINGHAVGGGCEIALACDIRIAAEDASLGLPEVTRGLIPGAGGTQRLARLVPLGEAMRLLLTGQLIAASEAYRIGLVQQVVPKGDILRCAVAMAEQIAANGPIAVRTIKEAVTQGLGLPLPAALAQEQTHARRARQSADAAEGIRAFVERRKPNFTDA
jgi:enoyl-CoA hydratase/carnithine racemase